MVRHIGQAKFESDHSRTDTAMLAEKFILLLESLIRAQKLIHADGAPRVVSTSTHVPIKPPGSLNAPTPIFHRQTLTGTPRRSESE
jgi:hypothetical protein